MPTNKQILELLKKADLVIISQNLGFKGWSVLSKDEIANRLSRKRSIPIDEILNNLKIAELRSICIKLDLDSGGQKKQALIDRIVGNNSKALQAKEKVKPTSKEKAEKKRQKTNSKFDKETTINQSTTKLVDSVKTENVKSHEGYGKPMNNFQDKANFIWQVADDILRGVFKQHEYGDIILPFVVLRRLDCVLEDKKDDVIKTYEKFKDALPDPTQVLLKSSDGLGFYNTSFYDLQRLSQDAGNIELNFNNYINGFSKNVREIIENFQIDKLIGKLVKNDLLFLLVDKFTEIDLHPNLVKNHEMGYIFEELLRRFSEMSNETAGEHYTPREVIRLMVNLLFAEHQDELKGKGIVHSVYDPACGTGGMLSIAKEHIQRNINPDIQVLIIRMRLGVGG